jgi:hypothetical protein
MRRDGEVADVQRFSIGHRAHLLHGRKGIGVGSIGELRVILHRATAFQRALAGRARGHLCLADALECRDAAGVIVVRMRVENELDVLEFEARGADVGGDQRRRLREAAIDEDVTLR